MKNFKEHIIQNKIKYIILFMLTLILAIASMIYYHTSYEEKKNGNLKIVANISDNLEQKQLKNNQVISQTFIINQDFEGFKLRLYAYNVISNGQLHVQLWNKDKNVQIQEWKKPLSYCTGNDFVDFSLSSIEKVEHDTQYTIRYYLSDIDDKGDIFYYYCTKTNSYSDGILYVGNDMIEKDLAFSVYQKQEGIYTFISSFFPLITILVILSVVFVYYFLYIQKDISVEKIFLPLILCFGIIYMLLLPPFSAPDEPMHFGASYKISNYMLGNVSFGEHGNINMRVDDAKNGYITIPTIETYQKLYDEWNEGLQRGEIVESNYQSYATKNLFLHTPGAIGITIARILQLGSTHLLLFGRLTNLLVFVLMTYFAIKITPIGKNILLAVSLTPMMLELVSSYSCDATINGIVFLSLSYILRCIYDKEYIRGKEIALLTICSFFLAPSKLVYVPILFLVILIPMKKFKNKTCYLVTLGLVFSVMILTNVLMNKSMISWMSGTENTAMTEVKETTELMEESKIEIQQNYSFMWCLHNPIQAIQIYLRSTIVNVPGYFVTLVGWALGWLEIHISMVIVTIYALVLLISLFIGERDDIKIKISQRSVSVISVICVYGLVLTSMFFAWTPIGSPIIEGVQGRYFLPIVPLAFLILNNKKISINIEIWKYIVPVIMICDIAAILEVFHIICNR
ncbi:MAG: DUF2142 domain-containing protein [Lachnospiraceae bacterium]|nr:DUF2142 domain-containing protein [Lachnospiraceae bacterium]